jgi:murein DD-endopeptidase MepM/ murein hydrolase activator NlpD
MKTYTVKSGDTLSAIAKAHGISLKKLLEANPKFTNDPKFQGGNMIWSGTTVKIPTATTSSKPQNTQKDSTPPAATNPPLPTPRETVEPVTPQLPQATPVQPVPVYNNDVIDFGYASGPEQPPPPPVKSATPDIVTFVDETLTKELISDILFEQIGGQEIISIARNDTVNGQPVIYQPIKNLGILQETYNPTSLLRLQETSDKFFSNFLIDLKTKIPKVGSGLNGVNYYLDLETGDGIIELANLKTDEQVEVQIITGGIIEELGV